MLGQLKNLFSFKSPSFSSQRLKGRFFVVSILGLVVLGSLSTVGFLVQNYALTQQESLQTFHSIVSRQVATVQKMSILAEELKAGNLTIKKRSELLQVFRNNVEELRKSKALLREWIITTYTTEATERLLRNTGLEEQLASYLESAETITDTGPYSPAAVRAQAERFTHRVRTDLVDVQNLVLNQVVTEAQAKANLLKWTSYSVVALVFGSAFLLWLLVFNPMFKTILTQQENLVEAVYRAEMASRSKTEFLANISHEIRTPMTAILGYAEVLEAKQETKPEVRQAFKVIKTNANHLMRLIDDILDVSKVEAGGIEVASEKVSLRQIVQEVHSLLKVKAEQKEIYLKFSAQGRVPDYFHTDPVRLKQILFNVVGNAIKFTDSGGVRVLIFYRADQNSSSGQLQFLVKDSGCGIPSDQVQRLFKPFIQVDTTSRRQHGGTGLGLVLSKRLAQMLGGDTEIVETVENKGTTFSVTIDAGEVGPLVSMTFEAPAESQGILPDVPDALVNNQLQAAKILVVDDAIENCNLFRIYLEKAQAKVDVAHNGNEALSLAKENNYDLVFLDLQMPGKDGFEVLKELRSRDFNRPVIALTAHAMPEERRKTLSYGFDEHVSKPVSADKLISTAMRFLEGHA